MKIYTMTTKSHNFLFKEFFSSSLNKVEPDLELVATPYHQMCPSANYFEEGWHEMMEKKIDIYLEALESDEGYFIWSDVDIEFYKPFVRECLKDVQPYDIAFQKGKGPNGEDEYCAGFFICKINDNTKQFFKKIKEKYKNFGDDQFAINHNIKNINAGFLSDGFMNISEQFRDWNGEDIRMKPNVVMFHANYTVGISNKTMLLIQAKNRFSKLQEDPIEIIQATYGVYDNVKDIIDKNINKEISIQPKTFDTKPVEKLGNFLYIYNNKGELVCRPFHYKNRIMIKHD